MKARVLNALSLLSAGLLAGTFLYASLSVLPTFRDVAPDVHLAFRVALMRHNSALMPALMIVSIVMPVLAVALNRNRSRGQIAVAIAASACALIALLTTVFGNVPINGLIRTWAVSAPPHDWQTTLHRWDVFHAIRAAAAMCSFVLVVVSSQLRPD